MRTESWEEWAELSWGRHWDAKDLLQEPAWSTGSAVSIKAFCVRAERAPVDAAPRPPLCLLMCPFAVPQGGLIALLLLLLVFTVALYAQRRWHKRRRIPQKSASTEATHEIHYIPSVLLGPQARESFRNSRLQAHNSVIGVPIRETPILDDYEDEEEEETPQRAEPSTREDEFGSQVTRTLESLGRGGEEKPDYEKKGWWPLCLVFPSACALRVSELRGAS